MDDAIRSLASFDWLLFTSQNGVRFFVERCRRLGTGMAALFGGKVKIAAVGPATAEEARRESIPVEFVGQVFRGEALAQELGRKVSGKKVLLPRSDRAGAALPAALRALGAEVVEVIAYRSISPDLAAAEAAEVIRAGEVDVITFASPSAFHHLATEFGLDLLRRMADRVALASIGPVTSAAIRGAGLRVAVEATESTAAGLVAALTRYFESISARGV